MLYPVIKPDLKLDIFDNNDSSGPSLSRKILSFVQTILLMWQSLSEHDIQVTPISSAMTNLVFAITVNMQLRSSVSSFLEDYTPAKLINEPESLLLRVYGESSWMFDRENEIICTMKLAETGAVPSWYAVFENGRFEEYILSTFIPASQLRQLETSSKTIAGLGKIHRQFDSILLAGSTWKRKDYLWKRLSEWKLNAKIAISTLLKSSKTADHIQKIIDFGIIDSEQESKAIEIAKAVKSPIVLGHCDLHHANILQEVGTGRIVIIDLEYAMPTTRGFDLANFFNEFSYDYNSSSPEVPNPSLFPSSKYMDELLEYYDKNEVVSCNEIWPFLPIVQLLWGYWGIIKAAEDRHNNDYNYLLSVEHRFLRFQELYNIVNSQ